MSFRTRLTTFFLLIVIVPMIGVSALVLRLISDSQKGKIDARASGLATSAQSLYLRQASVAAADARAVAMTAVLTPGPKLESEVAKLLSVSSGLARIELVRNGKLIASAGDPTAIAPGYAVLTEKRGRPITVGVSGITAAEYAQDLSTGAGTGIVVQQSGRTLVSSFAGFSGRTFAGNGALSVGGVKYRYVTLASLPSFSGRPVTVTVLSDERTTASSENSSRLVAAAFIAGFLILAFAFSLLASRALEGQLGRFLQAARRLASGDFSAPVPIDGSDDFSLLGVEFNNMSDQLAHRLDQLTEARGRLLESIRRTGRTFASNLDRRALLDLALRSSVDAVTADGGRLTVRREEDESRFAHSLAVGELTDFQQAILDAERQALSTREFGEAVHGGVSAATIALAPSSDDQSVQAMISVARRTPFNDDDRELLRSLARQATLALENVQLHVQVSRQAVTDRLTGLANHGRFQELLASEMEQVRRYHHPVGLIMIDIDNFKKVNDTYGHQQGDVVLREVSRVLRENSRDADAPARYGGEELALVLPHTDIEGSYAIAERVRTAIESLQIERLDQEGILRITASLGVAATVSGEKDSLIADADGALYTAKRSGKNRTVRAPIVAANLPGGE